MIHETNRSSLDAWGYLVLVATALHLQQSSAFTTPCSLQHVRALPLVRCVPAQLAAVPKKKLDYENYFDDLEKEEEEPQEPEQPEPSLQPQLSAEHDYTLVGDTDTSSSLSLDKIHRAIAARRSYQRKRDFRKADQILNALNRGGVFLHDKRREWRGDGVNSFGAKTQREVHYVRRGGNWDNYSQEEIDKIQSLIQQRRLCKHKRQFERADALEAELKGQYNVQIDDDRLEWSFTSQQQQQQHDYVHTPLVDEQDTDLDADTHDKIQQLVRERSLARANKDFAEADQLRDTLLEDYSVVMDDRAKEWKVVLDWKEEDANDPFVVEARASQRSAFAQSRDHRGTNRKKTNKRDEDLGDDDMDALSAAVDAVFAEKEVVADDFKEHEDEQTNEGGEVEERYASVDEIIAQEFAADDSQQIEEEEEQTNDEVVGAVALAADQSEEAMIEEEQTIDEDIEELSAEVDAALAEEFASDKEQGRPIVQVLEEDEASLKALTVPVLKEKLRLQGLPVSGRKADLIDRLLSN